jgi:hypothetical protein
MAEIRVAVGMTDEQIEKLVDKFRIAVRQNCSGFSQETVETALRMHSVGMECFTPFRQRIEALDNLIVHTVLINNNRTARQVIDDACFCKEKDCDEDIIDIIPRSSIGEHRVFYFHPREEAYDGLWISPEALEKEYEYFGLTPDPYAVAVDNEANPSFANLNPNLVQWRGSDGNLYYIAFCRSSDVRYVNVGCSNDDFNSGFVFGGVRK